MSTIFKAVIKKEGNLEVSIDPNFGADSPGKWGIVLCDILKHLAICMEKSHGMSRNVVLKEITDIFQAEWDNPTDFPEGEIHDNRE